MSFIDFNIYILYNYIIEIFLISNTNISQGFSKIHYTVKKLIYIIKNQNDFKKVVTMGRNQTHAEELREKEIDENEREWKIVTNLDHKVYIYVEKVNIYLHRLSPFVVFAITMSFMYFMRKYFDNSTLFLYVIFGFFMVILSCDIDLRIRKFLANSFIFRTRFPASPYKDLFTETIYETSFIKASLKDKEQYIKKISDYEFKKEFALEKYLAFADVDLIKHYYKFNNKSLSNKEANDFAKQVHEYCNYTSLEKRSELVKKIFYFGCEAWSDYFTKKALKELSYMVWRLKLKLFLKKIGIEYNMKMF